MAIGLHVKRWQEKHLQAADSDRPTRNSPTTVHYRTNTLAKSSAKSLCIVCSTNQNVSLKEVSPVESNLVAICRVCHQRIKLMQELVSNQVFEDTELATSQQWRATAYLLTYEKLKNSMIVFK